MDDVDLGVLDLGFAGRAAGLCVLGSSNRPQFRSGPSSKIDMHVQRMQELIANDLTLTTHLSRPTNV
jgi:hypothetical protein